MRVFLPEAESTTNFASSSRAPGEVFEDVLLVVAGGRVEALAVVADFKFCRRADRPEGHLHVVGISWRMAMLTASRAICGAFKSGDRVGRLGTCSSMSTDVLTGRMD